MEIRIKDCVEKFIETLGKTTHARTMRGIELLERFNYELRLPHSKKIKKDLFELRIRGKQDVRIFYTFYKNEIILLHGCVKKSQKIPKRELEYVVEKLKNLDLI